MVWNNESTNVVSREEAIVKIHEMAKTQEFKKAFKVFYDGEIVSTQRDLPDSVDMTKVRVSAVLDQA